MKKNIRGLFLTRYERSGASSRLRTLQYLPGLLESGITSYVQSFFSDPQLLEEKYKKGRYSLAGVFLSTIRRTRVFLSARNTYDFVWAEKEILPYLPDAAFAKLILKDTPLILDFDDAVHLNYEAHRSRMSRLLLANKITHLIQNSSLVLAGNPNLRQFAVSAGAPRVVDFPTVVDLARYSTALAEGRTPRNREKVTIAWIGSPSTNKYLDLIKTPLREVAEKFSIKLILIGGDIEIPGVEVCRVAWSEQTEIHILAGCDIGVMPLFDGPWERGKCGYKLIQYMALGLPVVASPVGVNSDIVSHGENGFLASSSDEWEHALLHLVANPLTRQKMGQAGKRLAKKSYSLEENVKLLSGEIKRVVGGDLPRP